MAETLFLTETRAKYGYLCACCSRTITKGARHFRHDPHPHARIFRGKETSHWCAECIDSAPTSVDPVTKRRRVRITSVRAPRIVEAARVEIVSIGRLLSQQLLADPEAVYRLSPDHFEEFVCDRFFAMGFEPKRIGAVNKRDGGIDIVFWPRLRGAFPFLGAAQVKHHRSARSTEGPSTVREFAGALGSHPFNAAMLVTNTSFTPDAEWYAREHAKLIRLREFGDLKRWLAGAFDHDDEWREIPDELELCPGVLVKLK